MRNMKAVKQTEIGFLPKEWEVVSLGEIGKLQYGYTTSAINKNTGIKFLRITDIKNDGQVDWERVPYCELEKSDYLKYSLDLGDILFARIGATTGKTAYVDREVKGVFASYLIRFKPLLKDLNIKFLYHFTQSSTYWIQVHKNKEGQLKKGLNAKVLANLKLPLPPLPEQKKIAEILSTVDKAIDKVDEAIEKTQRLKKGLMQELLTKGIRHKEFKDTETRGEPGRTIGRIPKEWEVVRLEKVIQEIKNGFASGKRDDNGIVQIRMNNVTTDGRLIFDSFIKVPIPENINEFLLKGNDFLFNNTNSIDLVGKSTIFKRAPFPCTFSNHFNRIRFNDELVPEWILLHFIKLWEKGFFKSVAIRHVGQSAVHTKYILNLELPLPPLPEQKKIAEILSTVDKRLDLLRKRKERLERVKRGLMNDLLSGRKRVKV